MAVYAATKAAVDSLARSLRSELRNEIKVFNVMPPWVDTELAAGFGRARMPAARVADAIVRALRRDRFDVYLGPIRALRLVSRLAPTLADAILAREVRKAN